MAELSKTAKASMVQNTEKKKDHFDTDEKKIAELRKQRNPAYPLAVNRFDFIDALIRAYDRALIEKQFAEARVKQLEDAITASNTIIPDGQEVAEAQS